MNSKEISCCFSVDSGNHSWEHSEVESKSPKTFKSLKKPFEDNEKTKKSFEKNFDMNKSLTNNKISENKQFPVPTRSKTPAMNQTKIYKNQEKLLATNNKKSTNFQHRLRPITSYNYKNNLNAIEKSSSRLKNRRSTLYDSLYINLLSSNLNQSVYSRSKRRHSNIFPAVSQSLNVPKGSSITFEASERPNTSRKLSPFSPNVKQTKLADGSNLLKTETTQVLNQALKPVDKTSFRPSLLKPTARLSKRNLLNKPTGLVKRNGNATDTLFRASPDSLPSSNLQRTNAKTPGNILRRASMPVVLKKEKPAQARTTAASSSKLTMRHLKREMLQPNKVDRRKPSTESRNPNTEHFKTIPETRDNNEIPRNETSPVPRVQPLTRENLKGAVGFEGERFTRERILEWLETAATGDEALQQVHHDLGNSPELAKANAIVVVYNEDLKN